MNPKNCISYWYKTVSRVIRTPTTRIVRLQGQLEPPGASNPVQAGVVEMQLISLLDESAIRDVGGLPCILRSGHTAAKLSWRQTCYIEDAEQILTNAMRIAEYAHSSVAPLPTDVWALRQLVPTRPLVKTYEGRIPVCPEWRIVVRGEEVLSCEPKWTREEILAGSPVSDEWLAGFDAYFALPPIHRRWAERAAQAAGVALEREGNTEAWAIDVIKDKYGAFWVLDAKIDEECDDTPLPRGDGP